MVKQVSVSSARTEKRKAESYLNGSIVMVRVLKWSVVVKVTQ